MRPVGIVMIDVLGDYQLQVAFGGDHHPVQALAAGAGNPAFRDRTDPSVAVRGGEWADAVQPRGQDPGAGQVPGGVQQLVPQLVQAGFQGGEHRRRPLCVRVLEYTNAAQVA